MKGAGNTAGLTSVLVIFLTLAMADDRFTCCMGGWKVTRGVTLCDAPCCPGYEERVLEMPLLRSPVVCHKLTQEEITRQKEQKQKEEDEMERRMMSTTPVPSVYMVEDEPRRMARTSSEFEDFLYRHRHFLLSLLQQGYSTKQLLTDLENFIKKISSKTYQPEWFRG